MKTILRPIALCSLAALLCACAATSIKKTWKSPDCQNPVGKIAVLTIEERGLLRQGFENRYVAQLTKAGATAMTTYNLLSLDEIKQDKRAAAEVLRTNGAEALVILRLVDSSTSYFETQPGGPRYAATFTGTDSLYWYDYYTVAFTDISPTYGSMKQRVFLETSLYDMKTEKCLWTALTQTVAGDNTDRVAEMDPLVHKIVTAMHTDGVIR